MSQFDEDADKYYDEQFYDELSDFDFGPNPFEGDGSEDVSDIASPKQIKRGTYKPRDVICKYCRAGELHWKETDQGWRLLESSNKVHRCDQGYKASQNRTKARNASNGPFASLLEEIKFIRFSDGSSFMKALSDFQAKCDTSGDADNILFSGLMKRCVQQLIKELS